MPLAMKTSFAERDFFANSLPRSPCDANVGPGTYPSDLRAHSGIVGDTRWEADEIACAFHCSSKRPPIQHSRSKQITPSPDTYNVRLEASTPPPDRPRTGPAGMGYALHQSTFRSRGPRMSPMLVPGSTGFLPSTIRDNPGPGDYEVSVDKSATVDLDQWQPKLERGSSAVPVLGTSLSAPSVPVLRDPSKVKYTGRDGNTLGPGDYESDSIENPCHVMRKTAPVINFHASESNRTLYPPGCAYHFNLPAPANPGAGTYNLRHELSEGKGTEQPFRSLVPQLTDFAKRDTPGPGTYPNEEEPLPERDSKEFPGMTSTSSRSRAEWWRPQDKVPLIEPDYLKVPGPGTYNPSTSGFKGGGSRRARSSGDILGDHFRHYHSVHAPHIKQALRDSDGSQLCGFLSTTAKDADKPLVKKGVSPGDYNNTESMGQSMMSNIKAREPVGKKGVFGSCNDRFHGFALAPKKGVPGPGDYEHGQIIADKRFTGPTQPGMSAFKNEEKQRPTMKPGAQGQSPGQYEPVDKANYRNKFRQPSTDHLSFGLGHNRWDPREVFVGTLYQPLPGPGEYTPFKKGVFKSGNGRTGTATHTEEKMKTPRGGNTWTGPGQYNVRTNLVKGSFNVAAEALARRAQGKANQYENPNVGGGAGGGAAATRARMMRQQSKQSPAVQPRAQSSIATYSSFEQRPSRDNPAPQESPPVAMSAAAATKNATQGAAGQGTIPKAPAEAAKAGEGSTSEAAAAVEVQAEGSPVMDMSSPPEASNAVGDAGRELVQEPPAEATTTGIDAAEGAPPVET